MVPPASSRLARRSRSPGRGWGRCRRTALLAALAGSALAAACGTVPTGSAPVRMAAVSVPGAPLPGSPLPAPTSWQGLDRLPCRTRVADTTAVQVTPDTALDRAFTSYGNTGAGWTGGDSVHAYVTGPRSVVWAFADSFLGPIGPGGTRPPTEPLIHSLFVTQQGNRFRTLTGGAPGRPVALVDGPPRTIYLSLAGIRTGNRLQELLLQDRTAPSGAVTQVPSGTLVATYSLPGLRRLAVRPLHRETSDILWGAAVTRWGGQVYVYGATAAGDDKALYVAQVQGADLAGPWRYWDGSGWSADPGAAAAVAHGVSAEVSVTDTHGMAVLVTSPTTTPYSPLVAFGLACSPTGPFRLAAVVRATYYTGAVGKPVYKVGDVYAYDALDQADLNRGSTWLISFDQNTLRYSDLAVNDAIYRPGYLWVRLGPRGAVGKAPAGG